MSSGEVSIRTRITGRPAWCTITASSAEKTTSPETAPGDAGSPRAITVLAEFRIESRMEQLLELQRIDAHQRGALVDQLFFRHLDCRRTAAAAVRLPLRVCSMEEPARSIVNSMSCMSRNVFRAGPRS